MTEKLESWKYLDQLARKKCGRHQVFVCRQHAFYQFLRQGKTIVSADFIAAVSSATVAKDHHQYMIANLFAQTQALMKVRCVANSVKKGWRQVILMPLRRTKSTTAIARPTLSCSTVLIRSPSLIALYEDKVFVWGIIWRVCSFDQWGIELGKVLANQLVSQLEGNNPVAQQDSSTEGLIHFYRELNQ